AGRAGLPPVRHRDRAPRSAARGIAGPAGRDRHPLSGAIAPAGRSRRPRLPSRRVPDSRAAGGPQPLPADVPGDAACAGGAGRRRHPRRPPWLMYRGQSIAVILPALNEGGKVGRAVSRIPRPLVDEVVVVDDGSSDTTAAEAEAAGARVLRHATNRGVGAAIRTGIEWAQEQGIALTGIMAGDDQDDPKELVRLAEAIVGGGYQFVAGARYLPHGRRLNQPLSRTLMTRGYSVLLSLLTLHRTTYASN